MRKHGLSSPECKIDGFDGAGDSSNSRGIDTQNVYSAHQIGNHACSIRIFAGCNGSDQIASQLMSEPHIRCGKGVLKEVQA